MACVTFLIVKAEVQCSGFNGYYVLKYVNSTSHGQHRSIERPHKHIIDGAYPLLKRHRHRSNTTALHYYTGAGPILTHPWSGLGSLEQARHNSPGTRSFGLASSL